MLTYTKKAGSTDVSVVIRIIDSADGTPETGVVFNTSGIDLEYRREGAASTDITEATLSALTDAHSDGGFLHIGNGYYRLDLPDAAVAAGATGVLIHGIVTGMVVIGCYVELVAYDPADTVRLGLTALPNAAAEAAGGLYTRGTGAGQINQPANGLIDVNAERLNNVAQSLLDLKDFADEGYDPATNKVQGVVLVDTATTLTNLPAITANWLTAAGTAADFGTEVGTAVWAAATRTLTADGLSNVVTWAVSIVGNITGNLSGSIGSVGAGGISSASFATTAGSFPHLSIIDQGTAQSATSTTLVLRSAAAFADDELIGARIEITGGSTGVGQSRLITDYVSSTDTATVSAWTTTPSGTITYKIFGDTAAAGGSAPTAAEVADAVWDEARSGHGGAGSFGEYVLADAIKISGDATAADNLELAFDGTGFGFTNCTIPTVTTLTNLPAITANWLTAAGTAADFGTEVGTAVWATTTRALTATGLDLVTAWTVAITGNITGNLSGSVGSVTGAVGSVTGSVGSIATGGIAAASFAAGALNAAATANDFLAEVNAEIVDALATDTYAEPGQGTPAATTSLAAKINYIYKAFRNKKTQTATVFSLFGDDAATVDQKATVSDDGTTLTTGELTTGP